MKNLIPVLLVILLVNTSIGQKKNNKEVKVPMESAYWKHNPEFVEFITHRSVKAIRPKKGGLKVSLNDIEFTDGTIEYDVELTGMGFPGIYFRMSEDGLKGELFYIRSFGPTSPLKRTTLQYAAMTNGVNIWDLSDDYQTGATIYQEGWNHVKLVISGHQMKVYVNDMTKVALHVPNLEGLSRSGSISLEGNVIYANFVIRPGKVEGLSPEGGYDRTQYDPRYLRNWQVTEPVDFPYGREVIRKLPPYSDFVTDIPDSTVKWTPIVAGNRALVNISDRIGMTKFGERKLAWLKTTISSDTTQLRHLDLGFSDEVWVFINGRLLYTGKNIFGTPGAKEPNARCTIENTSFQLPLMKGKNEILIALANDFYGGGIIARVDNTEGLSFE